MKVIFIPVSDRPECALALHQGFMLGQQTGASVIGCHIRPHSSSDINLSKDIAGIESYDMAWEASLKESNKTEETDLCIVARNCRFTRAFIQHTWSNF